MKKGNRMDGFYYRRRYVYEKNKADNGQDSLRFIHYVILFVAKISSVEGIHGKKNRKCSEYNL